MNKFLYNLVGHIPIVGKVIQMKTNFFAMTCSPFMEEFSKTNECKIIMEWLKIHPNQVISPKTAKELISKARNK